MSECDREASIMRWHWPTRGCSNDRRAHFDCGCLKQLQNVVTEHDDFQIGLAVLMKRTEYKKHTITEYQQ